MTPALPDLAIRASAGSGKTFELTGRYLRLLADGAPPERILATTFTRKAAGEIRERLFARLLDAARRPEKAAELADQLGLADGSTERFTALLRTLVRSLHRLRVETIDGFFQRLARSAGPELGLPAEWRVLEETEQEDFLRELLADLQRDAPDRFAALIPLLFKGETRSSIQKDLIDEGMRLDRIAAELEPEAFGVLPSIRISKAEEDAFEEQLAALLSGPWMHEGAMLPKVVRKIGDCCDSGNFEGALESKFAVAIDQGLEKYSSAKIRPPLRAAAEPVIQHLKRRFLAGVAWRNEATGRLVSALEQGLAGRLDREGALRFQDVTRRLADAVRDRCRRDSPLRLDGRIEHLLLDEFQDTSGLQWEVLRPIARDVTGAEGDPRRGGTFLCVGDRKQAIYGWRGGLPEIFDHLQRDLPSLEFTPRDRSYRSSPVIIDFVNRVFETIADNEGVTVNESSAQAARFFAEQFHPHSTAKKDLDGHVTVWSLLKVPRPKYEKRDEEDEPLILDDDLTVDGDLANRFDLDIAMLAGFIEGLATANPEASIGVLFAANRRISALAEAMRWFGVTVSEEGRSPIADEPPVAAMLSALLFADHPGDLVARFHLATGPLGAIVGLGPTDSDDRAGAVAAEIRRQLCRDSLAGVLGRWVRALEPGLEPATLTRLETLVDLARRQDDDANRRPSRFVRLVDEYRESDPASAGVRLMTIHRSKGLEFDIVVLPELDRDFQKAEEFALGRREGAGRVDRACRWVRKELLPYLPDEVRALFETHQTRYAIETLCLLYVALTRARRELHLFVAPNEERSWGAKQADGADAGETLSATPSDGKGSRKAKASSKPPQNLGSVICRAIGHDGRVVAGSKLYSDGRPSWFLGSPEPAKRKRGSRKTSDGEPGPAIAGKLADGGSAVKPPAFKAAKGGRKRGLGRITPSSTATAAVRLSSVLSLDDPNESEALRRGTAMHEILSRVEWLASDVSGAAALASVRAGGQLTAADLERHRPEAARLLDHPALRPVFTRSWWERELKSADLVVWSERAFAVRRDDAVMNGRFDRVVLARSPAGLTRAVILDYKTDRLGPLTTPATLAEHYAEQLRAYRHALGKLTGLRAAAIDARLVLLDPASPGLVTIR
jgi:ATP-dependent exoDNAse (exonuclease V) beta subunit